MIAFSLPVFRRGLVVGRLCKSNNNNNDNINKKKKESMKNKIFGLTNIFKNLIEILRKCFLKGPIHRLCKCLFNTVPRMHTNLVCHVWSRYNSTTVYIWFLCQKAFCTMYTYSTVASAPCTCGQARFLCGDLDYFWDSVGVKGNEYVTVSSFTSKYISTILN